MTRMHRCTGDSWSFIQMDVLSRPLEEVISQASRSDTQTNSMCSLRHQEAAALPQIPCGCLSSSFKRAEPNLFSEGPHSSLSDLILSFAAQTGLLRAWEKFFMVIWHMTSTWQNLTHPPECVPTSTQPFLSFLLISCFVSAWYCPRKMLHFWWDVLKNSLKLARRVSIMLCTMSTMSVNRCLAYIN